MEDLLLTAKSASSKSDGNFCRVDKGEEEKRILAHFFVGAGRKKVSSKVLLMKIDRVLKYAFLLNVKRLVPLTNFIMESLDPPPHFWKTIPKKS